MGSRSKWLCGLALLALAAGGLAFSRFSRLADDAVVPFEPVSQVAEPAPPCPWRDPEADLRVLFPEADRFETKTFILSGRRLELARRLGRQPTGEENALRAHRVFRNGEFLGSVVVQRVKGEHGAIELVLAVAPGGEVRGARVQRHREPPAVARRIEDPAWLGHFNGRSAHSEWTPDQEARNLPAEAGPSAAAIAEAIRSQLILLSAAEGAPLEAPAHHRH